LNGVDEIGVGIAFIEKLWGMFNAKRLSLRKAKWDIKPWGEYEFECACEEEWAFYLNNLGCEVVDGGVEALAEKWNFSDDKDSICIRDPHERKNWIFVPREIAVKAMVLGYVS
jgi:hypothetical protein